jgi:putative transposase
VDLSRWVTEVKRDWLPWLQETSSTTATQSLRDLDAAFRAFFQKRGRYPRFKRRKTEQAVRYQLDSRLKDSWVPGERLDLPKLGRLKIVWSRVPQARPKMVTVRRDAAERWWVSMAMEEEIPVLPKAKRASVGIDLGLRNTVVLSDGTKIGAPRHQEHDLHLLAHRQGTVERRRKGSNRRKGAVRRVARVHVRIRDRRRDSLHKLSTSLVHENQVIGVEDLNLRGIVKNRRLARSASDAALGELRRMLEYKCRWYGRTLVTVGRFFPSTKLCSACGFKLAELPLSLRRWRCPECGVEHDRDVNAAVNIEREGLRKLREGRPEVMRVEGGETGDTCSVPGRSVKRESWSVPSKGLSLRPSEDG